MPRKTDIIALGDKVLDRRVKLLPCQRERIGAMHEAGTSIHSLSKIFHVSRRTIQFLLYPERHQKNLVDRDARGGSSIYYVKEKHTQSVREHRQYKKTVLKND